MGRSKTGKGCFKTEKDVPKQERHFKTGKGHSKTGKDVPKQEKDVPKQEKDVPKQEKVVLKQKRTFQNRKRCSKTGNYRKKFHFINVLSFISVPRDVPGQDETSCQNPVLSRGKIFSLSRCPFVPGQGRSFCPFVPKSCAVPSRWKRYFKPMLIFVNFLMVDYFYVFQALLQRSLIL